MISELSTLLDDGVACDAFPAAQVAVMVQGTLVHATSHGSVNGQPTTEQTLFDIASLTKLVATTTALALLHSASELRFSDRVARFVPEFARNGKADITVRHLLAHSSGLAAWVPLFEQARHDPIACGIYPGLGTADRVSRALAFERARKLVVKQARSAPLAGPTGQRVYSDLGFIVLGELVSAITGQDFDTFCAHNIFAPVGLHQTQFFDLRGPVVSAQPVAPTGDTRPRQPAPGQEALFAVHPQPSELHPGHVDDDNAYAMHGVAGHAGVFSTAREVAALGQVLLGDIFGARQLVTSDVLTTMSAVDSKTRGVVRGLGFDRIAPVGSSAGTRLGKAGPLGGVGHLGFTGCSLWLDLDRRAVVVLLSNRTLLGRDKGAAMRRFRPRFHDLVADILDRDLDAMLPTDPGVML